MHHPLLCRWQGSLLGTTVGRILNPNWGSVLSQWCQQHYQGVKIIAITEKWEMPIWQVTTATELALLSLPLLLYFHDQVPQWREPVLKIAQQQRYDPMNQAALLAYGTVISWALTEQFPRKTLFGQLLSVIDDEPTQQLLKQLQRDLDQGKSLASLGKELPDQGYSIWLALYCVATTPEEFALTVKRAAQHEIANPLLTSLVGAIAGAHNRSSAIPIRWRYHLKKEQQQWQQPLEQMFATWSGSYQFGQISARLRESAIAPAGVIQPRNHQPY